MSTPSMRVLLARLTGPGALLLLFSLLCTSCGSPLGPASPVPTETPVVEDLLTQDIGTIAKQQGISLEEAMRRATDQEAIGKLNERLEQEQAETFAGLWIQHEPEYRVVVAFTRNGRETIKPYVDSTPLAAFISLREMPLSLAELRAVQQQVTQLIREFDWPFSSAIVVQDNQIELYVTDRALMEADLLKANRRLPEHVQVIVNYQPVGEPPPFPVTPVPFIAMPRLRARSSTFMMALAVGKLHVQNGCLRIGESLIIWQPDYFLNDNKGQIEVLGRNGEVLARVGEEVRMSGGEIPLSEELSRQLREPIPESCQGPYWLMGEIETPAPTPATVEPAP